MSDSVSFRQLSKAVWTLVAQHVCVPQFTPGTNKRRGDLEQKDLAAMMRVSKLVNLATSPVLYESIITDDLQKLFYGFTRTDPTTTGILPKAELLKHVRNLHLEYPKRRLSQYHEENASNTHIDVPGTGTGLEGAVTFTVMFPQLASLIDIEMIFIKTKGAQLDFSMPNLDSMAVGAYLKSYDAKWAKAFGGTMDLLARVGEAQRVMTRMFLQGKVKHFCQGGVYGPLCLHPAELHKYQPANLPIIDRSFTLHLSLGDFTTKNLNDHFSSASSPAGTATVWCFDGTPKTPSQPYWMNDYEKPLIMVDEIRKSLKLALVCRHENRDAKPDTYQLQPICIDAYIPLTHDQAAKLQAGKNIDMPHGLTTEERKDYMLEKAANRIGQVVGKNLLETGVENKVIVKGDRLAVHYIKGCPACPACNWTAKGM